MHEHAALTVKEARYRLTMADPLDGANNSWDMPRLRPQTVQQ